MHDVINVKQSSAGQQLGNLDEAGEAKAKTNNPFSAFPERTKGNAYRQQHQNI